MRALTKQKSTKSFDKSKTKNLKNKKDEKKQLERQQLKQEIKEREQHLKHALANFMNQEQEEERLKLEKQQEREKEHKEEEKQTRYILKNVKLVQTKNYTTALSLSAVEKFDLTQKLANLWNFISYCEREITRPKILNIIFICVYFFQLFSISVSSISPTVSEISLNTIYYIARSSRVIPLLATLNYADIVGLIVILVICIIDSIFFYCAWDLSNSSTKEEENNFKLKKGKAQFVLYYLQLYRWFLIVPKIDIALGGFFCGVLNDSSKSANVERCSDMLSFSKYQIVIAFFSFLQIISIVISTYLFVIVYNTASFMPANPIKSRYSNKKFIEIFLVFIFILFSYPQVISQKVLLLIMQHIIGVYYQLEYFIQFPLLTREYTTIYANIINTYAFACVLQTIRYSVSSFLDKNFLIYLTIVSTFLMALQQSYMTQQLSRIRAFDLKDQLKYPNLACLYFEELLFLSKNSLREKRMYLIVLGMLEFHQQKCRDQKCPCQVVEKFEDYGYDIPLNEAKLLNTPIGLYLYNLSKDHGQFVIWVMKFVDYHIRDLIHQLEKTHIENNQIYQDVSMRFWFFCIRTQKNVIKALFSLKANSKKFVNKSRFFQIIELATGRIIENSIKTKDKSMKYSYRQKDAEKARQFELFENMVASEAIKKNLKKFLQETLNQKQDMMQKLIDGYESFDDLFKSALDLLKNIEKLENLLRNEISYRKDNIEYLRLLSILKIRLLNDPISCKELDKKIIEINDRDKFQDENTVNSLNILKGNVVSMISGFSTAIASILAFSESSPSFFGYKKSEFETLSSLNDLIPECIAVWHDNYMIRLVETGVSKIIRRYRVAIAKNKEGFMFPINIYVNYFWHINYDFCFSALMLKLKTNSQFVLVDPKGIIKDMSANFYKFFSELYPRQIDINVLTGSNISLIIPKLQEVFDSYETSQSQNAKFEVNLPRKLNQFLKDYKSLQKNNQAFNNPTQVQSNSNRESENENSKVSITEFITQSSKNYGMHYLTFEAICSIKQENIPFYNGGALILYLIEIQSYTPINPYASTASQPMSSKPNLMNQQTLGDSMSSTQQIQIRGQKDKNGKKIDNDKKNDIKFELDGSNLNDDYIFSNIGAGGSATPFQFQNDGRVLEAPFIGVRKYDQEMQVQDMDQDLNNLDIMKINKIQQINHTHFLTTSQDDLQDFSPANYSIPQMKSNTIQLTENNEEQAKSNQNGQHLTIHQTIEKDTKTSSSSDPIAGINTPYNQLLQTGSMDQLQGNSFLIYTQNNFDLLNDTQLHLNQTLETNLMTPKNNQIPQASEINVTQSYNQNISIPSDSKQNKESKKINSQNLPANSTDKYKGATVNFNYNGIKKEGQINQIPEEILPFEGTSHHTEELSQRFKELSKKSGTIITFTNQLTKSDGEKEDDLNVSSSEEENVNKKGWEDDIHQQNSISSKGNRSTYNIVKQIHAMANEKRMPGFLMALYCSYTTQWALFILLSLITFINIYNQLQNYKVVINDLQFSSSFMIPLSFISLSGNYIGLSNSNIITTSNSNNQNFFFSNLNQSFNITKQQMNNLTFDELIYSYQNFLLEQQIQLKLITSNIQFQNNIIMYETLSSIVEMSFEFIQNQNAIFENSTLLYTIQQNYDNLNSQFDNLDKLYAEELENVRSNLESINLQILIISILMLVIFSALIVPPFKKYRDQVLRILKTISRITEEEAINEILHIKQASKLLDSENEEYLITRFGELQQKEDEQDEMARQLESKHISTTNIKSMRKSQQKKEKPKTYSSVYLNDRVKSNKLSFWLVFIIIFVLFMCSCVFLSVYFVLRNFLDTFSKPIQDQLGFSRSIRYYGSMSFSKNMNLISQSIQQYKTLNQNYNNFYAMDQNILNKMQDDGVSIASSFLLGEFLQMGINSSQTNELKNFLQSINNGNTCQLFSSILNPVEMNVCLTASNGLINIGLKNAITQSINQVSDFTNWSNKISYQYLMTQTYVQEIQVQELVMKMFINIMERIGKDNCKIIDNYAYTILLIYLLGGILITILFLAISVYSLLNTLKNFTYLRMAIYLIPFKRLSEDSNTRFLLKKFMEFQSNCLC
ncbi:transmembrane protein, putative (macronuclear) [Tetrahymena thermophila SB210]|uniref:Transmembrane protein, putative n=1 Tax=Tetrahymena thermophila (strain SB210) TaxID=312017 RepID=Q22HL5_TETTS|nr:transmembrane protein, putative [Tetrahymena thermophila SB210]EAR84686.2 transmembrane protein, putative [Tetrahymena thermophila SB210]|eukprot:XP_001032349.2 transmembrane protein, putative [Tetrahymena thermophila SB210]